MAITEEVRAKRLAKAAEKVAAIETAILRTEATLVVLNQDLDGARARIDVLRAEPVAVEKTGSVSRRARVAALLAEQSA